MTGMERKEAAQLLAKDAQDHIKKAIASMDHVRIVHSCSEQYAMAASRTLQRAFDQIGVAFDLETLDPQS
ncbi:hypothetical protein BKG77_07120 [Mycobacteroides chelonae]|uniref:hypothetical protein n=1 Tax=Mycobacteroides chelonae TaxID=1774 RepID=UPI0008A9DEB8|nr:hypothetical protein [Mycobacteroides chelonae]OHU23427.1 hypothetical protein BKG77_07120 [Mycobacteroides chelonae]